MIIKVLAINFTLLVSPCAWGDSDVLAEPKHGWLKNEKLSMLPLERETTANHLSAYVANHLIKSKRTDRTTWATRLLGLALILHPENPRAIQTNQAIARGTSLPVLESELDAEVFARLLYHRSRGLAKNGGPDAILAPFLLAAAAYIAPYLEETVFEHESRHLREGALNWTPFSGQAPDTKRTR
ncbi:hypothetical protein OAN94_02180 [Verrucomicrobiales bacterium]|nr:hypothetical protein [Verrucomicrobiales bacterium]